MTGGLRANEVHPHPAPQSGAGLFPLRRTREGRVHAAEWREEAFDGRARLLALK